MDPSTAIVHFGLMGLTFGLAGGLAPGPLTVVLIRQTLSGGFRAGLRVAIVPVLTDGPLIAIGAWGLEHLAESHGIWIAIGLIGAIFLGWLGLDSFRVKEITVSNEEGVIAGSWRLGITTNLVNPHPYLFWLTIGVPAAVHAYHVSFLAMCVYLIGFFAAIVGGKVLIAWLIARYGKALSGPLYRTTMRILGTVMILFAVSFVWDALNRLGWLDSLGG